MASIEIDDILSSVTTLCEDDSYKKVFSKFLELQTFTDKDRQQLINLLSELLFNSSHTNTILKYFSRYILQFLSIAIPLDAAKNYVLNYNNHVKNCVVLSTLAHNHPDANRFMLKYFEKYPAPFDSNYFENAENQSIPTKKRKLTPDSIKSNISDLDIVECCFNFLKISADFFRSKWNWSEFIGKYYNHDEDMVKWICCQCISIITGMSEKQLNKLLLKVMPQENITKCSIKHYNKSSHNEYIDLNILQNSKPYTGTTESNISDSIISVAGILLPVYQKPTEIKTLVLVPSTQSNLRKVALGISANRAICLQGPVGSSKTSLVEYLASITGRNIGESLIKVQLGDQTDSKMLLGTYRCTDIPGEFVWQLGVLTQAVTEGSWLLLEDIDSASMDIATVIISLLENGYLTVPGYRDTVPITPGFQLFVTQRLTSGITGYYKRHSNVNTLLEKHLMQVNIEPLAQDELVEIVKTLYPVLSTISTRIIDVFMLFSAGHSEKESLNIPTTGRLTSTRDLFKWCARGIIDFDITSPNSALKVLQDAIDAFCCSLPKNEDRLRLASEICVRLGIIETKAEYFCNNYKPSVSLTTTSLTAGRGVLSRDSDAIFVKNYNKFSFTRSSSCLLERIICCVNLKEPVLLVGETGTGKTSSIQYLAQTIGQKLIVINMNQQSDSADLLGGYKPVDLKFLIAPIKLEFELLFRSFFSVQHNQKFLQHIANCFNAKKWSTLLVIMKHSYTAAMKRLHENDNKKLSTTEQNEENEKNMKFLKSWTELGVKLNKLTVQIKQQNALAFAFIEGSLVKAVENGYWVLLDEINLANAETLECLSGLLEGSNRSLSLLERGDRKPVERHEKFTLFACMNPSTDVGKKDLPAGLRNRFTEFFVEELTEKNDLFLLVTTYLRDLTIKQGKMDSIVKFYLNIRKEATINLSDGLGHAPHYSLRTLCRALTIAAKNTCGTMDRNLYEAFCLSFLTQLDSSSYKFVEKMIAKALIGGPKELKSVLNQPMPEPKSDTPNQFVQFEGYWVSRGGIEPDIPKEYVLTESVRKNLKDLVRVVAIGRLPVLLQGDTSVGKTSLITYLAKSSGNKCVRINNHEHTDLQEYIGSYVADADGKLVFREGVLVDAMRKGYWIILDELNLAPTDVLEALNRVLDDNRELFIPETQDTVKAHPGFMLFATQNPPGAYGGRKMLSRAFRNRFVELHFNEIPPQELEIILHQRCEIPPSYCKKMIAVMIDLQVRRRGSAAFAGKQGFITLRDLFRWGERYRLAPNVDKLYDWDQHIADEGYLVLAGRVRKPEERDEITQVLLKHIKRSVLPENIFSLHENTSPVTRKILEKIYEKRHLYKNIVWTFNTRQLAVLVGKALEFSEPVLLVGETGGGKTTVCRLIAENDGQKLITVNCHMHTESSDFIGGLRPVRDHTEENKNRLFEWVDGPLIQAMQKGDVFLADEISLADDSVLERLNSLLEPERTLLLAEKGTDLSSPASSNSESLKAHERFHFIGTMNPGGDFGKKELSPALRNRFTEIWCESCTDRNDLTEIVEHNLKSGLCFGNQEDGTSGIGRCIMDFVEWFKQTEIGKRFTISIRDILTWVHFINISDKIDISESYVHGACLTFLDSFGSGVTGMENVLSLKKLRDDCSDFLLKQVTSNGLNPTSIDFDKIIVEENEKQFGIKPFFIEKGRNENLKNSFTFNAPTTMFNALRLLRGLQLNKAILLEGSPGVGKTSLVSALATATKHKLLRINLSDQTDICDLFGADLPVEGGQGGEFAWRDGPFLQALKNGDWIVLDELNLASQSVLEGLNACLDHRGEIFIPELGKTFYVQPGTRLFACQNPLRQGGSRRGLPRSFLNRFTQVYVDSLSDTDLLVILGAQFPLIASNIREKMVEFNKQIVSQTEKYLFGYKGSPWEFNLRDLTRWCEVMLYNSKETNDLNPESSIHLIYGDRMRTYSDKIKISEIFEEIFAKKITGDFPLPYITSDYVYLGDVKFSKNINCDVNLNVLKQDKTCLMLRSQYKILRSLIYCVNLNWMAILVGSGACGKSSVVRTLAQLTGSELRTLSVNSAMDTMDILGGFEQVDYNRHLEEISNKTERLLLCTVQKCLLKNKNIKPSMALLSQWELYKNVCIEEDNSNRTMADETKRFDIRLVKLHAVLQFLKLHDLIKESKELIMQLLNRLEKLKLNVEKEGTLNAGGKFEWVDSVLIKCLQDGCWLLIDNVNLCSPAVLDRLNALLEPNGILTIGERGVDENGEMIHIKPHPDFRLFLTMDPKNGEISRAMRNRGVEIYMLNECESEIRNELDVKALIEQNGISFEKFQDILILIHDFIIENILGEKPTVSHILQSSFLISQQLLRGLNIVDTFVCTIIDVYVKSRSLNDFKLNNPIDSIKEHIITTLQTHFEKNPTSKFENGHRTLKTMNLQNNCNFELVKQQTTLLKDQQNELTSNLLLTSYSITSMKNLYLRYLYIKNNIETNQDINDELYATLNGYFKGKNTTNLSELPLDSRWLPETIDKHLSCNNSNQLILLMHFLATKLLKVNNEIEPIGKKYTKFTVLQYSKEVSKKNISQSINDPLIVSYYSILKEFDNFMINILNNIDMNLNNDDAIHSIMILNWRFVLEKFGETIIYDKKGDINIENIISQLIVRYKWFLKKTVTYFKNINENRPSKFIKLIDLINDSIKTDLSVFKKIAKRYIKNVIRPLPLTDETQIKISSNYTNITSKLSLSTKNNEQFKKNVNFALKETEKQHDILKIRELMYTNDSEVIEEFIKMVDGLGIYKTENKVQLTQVQLLPINDAFILYVVKNIRNNLAFNNQFDENMIQMILKMISVPTELKGVLQTYRNHPDQKLYHEVSTTIALYLINSAALSPLKFLFWDRIDEQNFMDSYLAPYTPILSYSMSHLCVSLSEYQDLVTTVDLGSFQEKRDQYRYLNELLWQNAPAFASEKFDFLKNDMKYIVKSFKNFVETLEASQDLNGNITLCEKVEACIKKINDIYNDSEDSKEMLINKNNFIKFLQQCTNELVEIGTSNDDIKLTFHTANIFCLLNYCKALLNTQLQVIDPLQKVVLKKKYCEEERNICINLKKSLERNNEIYSGNVKTMHTFCNILISKITEYEEKEVELAMKVAVRPVDQPYHKLVKNISHHLNTLLSDDFFISIYEKLNNSIKLLINAINTKVEIKVRDCFDVYNQTKNWLNSQDNALIQISKYRIGYPDIIEPILSNLTELSYGIRLLCATLSKLITKYEYLSYDLDTFLVNLVQFPTIHEKSNSALDVVKTCAENKTITLVSKIVSPEDIPNLLKEEHFRLFKCSLQELYNTFIVSSPNYLSSQNEMLVLLNNLINSFVSTWNKQEIEKQNKLVEEKSLFKMQTKCQTLTEEEETIKEMKDIFQDFHDKDFSEFQEQRLEDSKEDETDTTDECLGIITNDDVKFVSDLHSELMLYFTKSEWLSSRRNKLEPNFIMPFLQRYKTFAIMLQKKNDGFNYKADKKLITSLNLLVCISKSFSEGDNIFAKNNSSPVKNSKEKNFDFYHDPKVEEVKTCLHLLKALEKRVDELLDEWSSHPTLQIIKTVIKRIYSFSLTSPIARFLTGLELLLSKCQEWEENAHSGVSLAEYSQNITLQIITWRKLELTCWKDSLNKAHEKIKNSVSKWWFHLYATVQQYVDDFKDEISPQQIIKTIKEFIENSSLGEFESRLELLFIFHCHSVHLPKSPKSEILTSVLWNLHSYYCQFLDNVYTKIKELRAPIEKKLKDFVKIARWNDINYWSIKIAVEKTHRTIHKHIKEFETVLKDSVRVCLVHTTINESTEQIGIWDRPQRHAHREYHYSLDPSIYMASMKLKKLMDENKLYSEKLVDRSEKYFTKSRTLCKDIISYTTYPNLIQNLDSFVTEVIETSNQLRNLEVNKDLPKPKQKSQAKSILQQKRKALADLFKTLTNFGVSYRAGIVESILRENSNAEFLIKPLDLKASFEQMKSKNVSYTQMLNIWDCCETYFMRSIARLMALKSALKQPAQDLGFQNIERCKGFAVHLMIFAQDQKIKLIETTRELYYLRHSISQFTDWNEEGSVVSTKTIKKVYNLLTNITIVMKQYEIILLSCPEQPTFESDVVDIPMLDSANPNLIKYKYEPNWNNTHAEIKSVISSVQKLKSYLDKFDHSVPNAEILFETPEYLWISDIKIISNDLVSISQKISILNNNFGDYSISDSLLWLSEEIISIKNLVEAIYVDEFNSEISISNFNIYVEKLMENILLVIQNMYKKYNEEQNKNKDQELKEDDIEEFKENHLRVAVIENLNADISSLEMKKILHKVIKIINALNNMGANDAKICRQMVMNCIPLLEQIVLMYEYFVTQQVAAYRVTCKMNSILLNIFTELASKGFCVPPEFADEMNKEGQSKQTDGMGLGEGEGEKDVSDRIENEDQLDDAQPAGQDKKKEEDKDCKEEEKGIEMSEDFDSKLQDVKQPDEDEESNDDSDADKQMGDTEPNSDKLDQQIWGSDEENEEEENEQDKNKEEKGDGGEVEDQKMSAKDDSSKPNEEENDNESKDKKKEKQKDIEDMNEQEIDDDQTDPYHGNQPQMPEPEPMDLPDDLQLDDGEEKQDGEEENPFDIDTMKEQMPPAQEEKEEETTDKTDDTTDDKKQQEDSSDEEETEDLKPSEEMDTDKPDESENKDEAEENKDTSGIKNKDDEIEEDKKGEMEETSGMDNQTSTEDKIEPMEVDNIDNSDNVETNPNQNSNNQQSEQISQEESIDKDGVGQTQMEESDTGHKGQANASKDSLNAQHEKEKQDKRQRPGESDTNRSLGETTEPVKKKLKTVNIQDKDQDEEDVEDEGAEQGKDADMYQHIKEAKETDTQVLDAATREQAETQKIQELEEEKTEEATDEQIEMATDEPEPEITDISKQKPEKTESKTDKKQTDGKNGDIVEEIKDIEIEGDVVETMNVARGTDSSYHTQYDMLSENHVARLSSMQIQDLRSELENQLGKWNEPPQSREAEQTWEKFSAVTSSLARDLSEQLRLVLEPTQASRLRGDFKTGRRINMRKVIPYIASQFRKDKIWLRRTKPSKREYQIVLAIDDSSSMDDNHSKELAFESVALISKALTLLESGQLSVLSFGETTDILHKLSDTFTEKSGVKLLQKFQFQQKKTCVANLVDFVTNMFSNVHTNAMNAKLLVVVSDGRGIFSEGELFVQQAIRRAKFADIFMVFVIIDNPENKSSILDIRMPVFKDGKLLGIKSYLDSFPFPFYIILRDINSLPSVLSDALRQWFELVTNVDK